MVCSHTGSASYSQNIGATDRRSGARQLGAILWALVITATLKTITNIALPLAGNYWLLPIGSVFVLLGVVIYAYAITNFKLFSLQSALDQFRLFPIAYKVALSIAPVAVLSFPILQIPVVWWSFGTGPDRCVAAISRLQYHHRAGART